MNIKTTFLYSFINQLIYIKLLKETKIKGIRNMVCKVLEALYNLK